MDKHLRIFMNNMIALTDEIARNTSCRSPYLNMLKANFEDALLPVEFQCINDVNQVGIIRYGFTNGQFPEWAERDLPDSIKAWEELINNSEDSRWFIEEKHVVFDLGWCKARLNTGFSGWHYHLSFPDQEITTLQKWLEPNNKLTNEFNRHLANLVGIEHPLFEEDVIKEHGAAVQKFRDGVLHILNTFVKQDRLPFFTNNRIKVSYGNVDKSMPQTGEEQSDEFFLSLHYGEWHIRVFQDGEVGVQRYVSGNWSIFDLNNPKVATRRLMGHLSQVLDVDVDVESELVHPTLSAIEACSDARPDYGFFPAASFTTNVTDETSLSMSKTTSVYSKNPLPEDRLVDLKKVCSLLSKSANLKGAQTDKLFRLSMKVGAEHVIDFARDYDLDFEVMGAHRFTVYEPNNNEPLFRWSVNPGNIEALRKTLSTLIGAEVEYLHSYEGDLEEPLDNLRKLQNDHSTTFYIPNPPRSFDVDRINAAIANINKLGTLKKFVSCILL
ncbi:hypothetical protein [Vibrio phage phiKT1028]|nr:hypothetical protein [Vibrio phage phiKT1028]